MFLIHLVSSFPIILNPPNQFFEGLLNIPASKLEKAYCKKNLLDFGHWVNGLQVFGHLKTKYRIRETLTLSACADSSTNTMKFRIFDTFLHFSKNVSHSFALLGTFCYLSGTFCTNFHVSHVTCHKSHVTFHRSLTPKATDLPLLTPPLSTEDWVQLKMLIQEEINQPTNQPINQPTKQPTNQPINRPTNQHHYNVKTSPSQLPIQVYWGCS